MIRVESKFVARWATNFDSIAGHSAVLTTAARVHLTAFDGHYLGGHKFYLLTYHDSLLTYHDSLLTDHDRS